MKKIETMIADHLTFGVELETIIPTDSNINVGGYHRGAPVLAVRSFRVSGGRPKGTAAFIVNPAIRHVNLSAPSCRAPKEYRI